MRINYSDELGYVSEIVDDYGITIDGTTLLFNDKKIKCENVREILEEKKSKDLDLIDIRRNR